MELNNFINWDYIATFGGTVLLVSMVIQFVKELPFIKKIPTRYLVYIVALIFIVLTKLIFGEFILKDIFVYLINALIVTFTATGAHDFTSKNVNKDDFVYEDENGNEQDANKYMGFRK